MKKFSLFNLKNAKTPTGGFFALLAASLFFFANPTLAADLFTSGKVTIQDTAGTGSMFELAILALGALGALVFGFISKNWVGAIAGFAVGVIFWNISAPLIGL